MVQSGAPLPPLAVALEWVGRITAISLLMFLPAVGGQWLDRRLGTQFLGLIGLVCGVSAAIYVLVQVARSASGNTAANSAQERHSRDKQ